MKAKKSEASEHDTQSAILEWLEIKGIFHYRQNTGTVKRGKRYIRFGLPGAPDIVAVVEGKFIGIEVKKRGESMSDKQKEFSKKLIAASGYYILAYDLEDVTRLL